MNKSIFAALVFAAIISGCGSDSPVSGGSGASCGDVGYLTDAELLARGEFTDARDCKVYRAVKIGDLIWMAENLNYNTLDGNGSWCYDKPDHYNDKNCEVLGRFYDWTTAMDIDPIYLQRSWSGSDLNHRGVCPDGWRLPNHRDWDNLIRATGDPRTAGTKLKAVAADSKYRWYNDADDEYGFAALPAAYRNDNNSPSFYYLRYYAYWWTATQYDYTNALYWYMSYQFDDVKDSYERSKKNAFNVRCVRGSIQ